MASEKEIRDLVTQKLGYAGWICWWSPRVKFRKQQDIFTIWDGVAAKGCEIRFIQFTTRANKSSHINKIKRFKQIYNLSHTGELWLWNGKLKEFEIIKL